MRASTRCREHDVSIVLAFSGGGTRAAAFAHGVLLELDRWRRRDRTLLDSVELVSSVSGGSLAAANFALNGRSQFGLFEERVLRSNLHWPLLKYAMLHEDAGLLSRRGYALARLLDDRFISGATVADVLRPGEASAIVNATEVSSGRRFPFSKYVLGLIGRDPTEVSLADAVAASCGFPVAFNPITLANRTVQGPEPAWVTNAFEYAPGVDLRRLRHAEDWRRYRLGQWPYLHLVDGGLSDNTGVHTLVDLLQPFPGIQEGSFEWLLPPVFAAKPVTPRRLLILAVNAKGSTSPRWPWSPSPPNSASVVLRAGSSSMELRTDDSMYVLNRVLRANAEDVADAGDSIDAGGAVRWRLLHNSFGYAAYLDFSQERDPNLRLYLSGIRTAFAIGDEAAQACIDAGSRLLRQSPSFATFCDDVGYESPAQP